MKHTAAVIVAALALAACSEEPSSSSPPPRPSPEPSTEAPPAGAPSPSPEPDSFEAPWEEVPCDAGREPTDEEARWLVEPGPHVADPGEEPAVRAVRDLDPSTPEEWSEAVQWAVQGDFAQDVCEMMKLALDLGETGAQPGDTDVEGQAVGRNHFAIALDASGSMAASSGGGTRMEQAKRAVQTFVADLPEDASVSLRVYGHEGSNDDAGKALSCEASEVIFQGSPGDAEFSRTLEGVEPVGWTPLGKAISEAAADIPADTSDAILYVVSDGIETCGGDPVQAAREVASAGISPIVNVIGFEVADEERAELEEVARTGGGIYVHAEDAAALNEYWEEERARLRDVWREWRAQERDRLEAVYDEQLDPARKAMLSMRAGLRDNDLRLNTLERVLQTQGVVDRGTFSRMIEADDAFIASGHALVDDAEARWAAHSEELRAAVEEVYETASTAWSDLYRER